MSGCHVRGQLRGPREPPPVPQSPAVTALGCAQSLLCEVEAEQEDELNMTSAFARLKACEGKMRYENPGFVHFMKSRENAPVKSLNAVSLARLAFAPLISRSADAVC